MSHEAHTADPDAVAAAFLGVDPGPMSSPPPPSQTLTPPAAGVAAAKALPAGMPWLRVRRLWA